jgi:hypothetical protein
MLQSLSYISVEKFVMSKKYRKQTSTLLPLFEESVCHFVTEIYILEVWIQSHKLRGFSPQANYTDWATAACRRS